MKQLGLFLMISAFLFIAAGCGSVETGRLRTENEELRKKVDSLEKEIASLKAAVKPSNANSAPAQAGTATPSVDTSSGEMVIAYSPEQNSAISRFLESNEGFSLVRDSEKLRRIRKELDKRLPVKNTALTACWGDFTGDGTTDIAVIVKSSKTGKYSVAVFNEKKSGGYEEPFIISKDMEQCDYVITIPPDKNFNRPVIHIQEIDSSGAWSDYYWNSAKNCYEARIRTDSD
jgi:hypothetical protein